MTTQRLHSALAPIDVLTREELEESLHDNFEAAIRSRVRGLDIARIPVQPVTALSATVNLSGQNPGSGGGSDLVFGPNEGDVWMLRRAIVKSSVFTDAAKYILFRGSTPSDVQFAYTFRFLLDGIQPPVIDTTMTLPAVPASGVAVQNTTNVPQTVVVTGFTATQTFVNGVLVGAGNGTFTVPAYGSISVTYTVAGTWTWTPIGASIGAGQNVNVGFFPANKSTFINSGEMLYAQVLGATPGNQYLLEAEAIRCPAEMKGKLL